MTVRPVIAGVDGSEEAFRAVEWAAREAALHRLPLQVVAIPALPPPMMPHWASSATLAQLEHQASRRALAVAARRAAEVAPALEVSPALLPGTPAWTLTEAARDASMLVVGSRGAGAFAALMLGSVSIYVATHAPCPVVVAREESMAVRRQVVIGVGDPEQAATAVEFAFEEAALRNARLLAVHAWPSSLLTIAPAAGHGIPGPAEALREAATRLEDLLADWREKYPQVQTGSDVAHGHPGRVLAGASARADLVVLGRRAPQAPHGPGAHSVTHAVLTHAHGPVATVPGD